MSNVKEVHVSDDLGVMGQTGEDGPSPESAPSSAISTAAATVARKMLRAFGVEEEPELSDREAISLTKDIRSEYEALDIVTLYRGAVSGMFDKIVRHVADQHGFVGKFVRDDELSISEQEAMRWKVYDQGDISGSNDDGTGRVLVGGLVLMVKSRAAYLAEEKRRREAYAERRAATKSRRALGEGQYTLDPEIASQKAIGNMADLGVEPFFDLDRTNEEQWLDETED